MKNKKSARQDGIPNELLKYGGQHLTEELTKLIQKMFYQHKIPDEWRTSTTILMFKKGDKKLPSNYRGINLLNITLKLTTKIITAKINSFFIFFYLFIIQLSNFNSWYHRYNCIIYNKLILFIIVFFSSFSYILPTFLSF